MRTRRPPGPTRITSSRPALIARRTVFSDTLSTPATSFTVINCCAWCGVELLGVLAIGALLIRVGGELLDIYRDHPSEQARQRQCGVSDVLIVRRMVWVFGLAGHAMSKSRQAAQVEVERSKTSGKIVPLASVAAIDGCARSCI